MGPYHREPIQTWRRKVKLTLAATALLGLLAGLLSIALESTDEAGGTSDSGSFFDESPHRSSSGEGAEMDDGPAAWFATEGGRGGSR